MREALILEPGETMKATRARAKRKGRTGQGDALTLLRGGSSVPEAFLRQRIADVKQRLIEHTKGEGTIGREYEEYWSRIHKPPKHVYDDPQVAQAMDGLLGIHKSLAKRKLAAPTVASEVSGFLPGGFGAKITPPFDYAFTLYNLPEWNAPFYGNPALNGSANKETGEIFNSTVSDSKAKSKGNVYCEMGIYLRPSLGPATLKVSASPASSFQWWTNSINQSSVFSNGAAGFGIYARQGLHPGGERIAGGPFGPVWAPHEKDQILFDFGSIQESVSAQLNDLDPSFQCLAFVSVFSQIRAEGWPGSLAGGIRSVTVPAITFKLEPIIVVSPD